MSKAISKPATTAKSTKSNQPPHIKLYLEKINQEMLRNAPSATGCDIYGSWKKECCILDFSLAKPGDVNLNPMRGLMLRKEGGGGLMWNPRTGAVYELNEAAYHAMLDLDIGLSEHEIARRNGLELQTVKALVSKLRRIV